MYNLDINFLNDRPEYAGATAGRNRRAARGDVFGGDGEGRNPLLIGALVGLLPLALIGLIAGGLSLIKVQAEGEREEVRAQVAVLEQKEKERDEAQAKLRQAEEQIQALTSVFSYIKPWSAMSQDLRDRLPPGVQITEIAEKVRQPVVVASPDPAASPSPVATPAAVPVTQVVISGYADNFDRVNDFLVVLQNSNFMKSEATRIVEAERMEPAQLAPVNLPGQDGQAQGGGQAMLLPKLPAKVSFKIETDLAQIPTNELLRELDRKGAVGLVSRIEALKEKGVIKP